MKTKSQHNVHNLIRMKKFHMDWQSSKSEKQILQFELGYAVVAWLSVGPKGVIRKTVVRFMYDIWRHQETNERH